MADFSKAAARVLELEGGFQKWKNDKGNYNKKGVLVGTNHGISAQTYEEYFKKTATEAAIRALTPDDALMIYKKLFWDRIKGDQIKNQSVAEIFFDGVVQHGKGILLMQQVLGVAVDGIVGNMTLAALNKINPQKIYTAYWNRRKDYYKELVDADSSQEDFYDGWMSRLDSFKKYIGANPGKVSVVTGVAWLVGIWAITKLIN